MVLYENPTQKGAQACLMVPLMLSASSAASCLFPVLHKKHGKFEKQLPKYI